MTSSWVMDRALEPDELDELVRRFVRYARRHALRSSYLDEWEDAELPRNRAWFVNGLMSDAWLEYKYDRAGRRHYRNLLAIFRRAVDSRQATALHWSAAAPDSAQLTWKAKA